MRVPEVESLVPAREAFRLISASFERLPESWYAEVDAAVARQLCWLQNLSHAQRHTNSEHVQIEDCMR